ncbi:CDGSH iron-sulfur domain-containing protein [Clostridium aminobutyricum]|uniref:CDGSH iron-sulfur domain-containing protein n=1 Tax=Clostridium aminobutyricum TaxID=33953 RepID=A0A939DA67_CLOAM|nr:CDGSH iron-sulfur domain-containing protein [Clostridium aminobutyricum]MBN7773887.1 CDGSH iron-sulfur domain-containing protein [Clostridium aminobutyricum]
MSDINAKCKIRIIEGGPYLVSGNVPISEQIIIPKAGGYEFQEGRELPQSEAYALCRCGKSTNAPFCDGSHYNHNFRGKETASKNRYHERAERMEGPGVDLLDDGRCAFARFCHRRNGDAWELVEHSDAGNNREEAIRAACDCPSGRLTAVDMDGTEYENEYIPSIDIIQDPERRVSAGIFVKGHILIESADGTPYEVRNRVALCRCGESRNKPFCDAAHVAVQYLDSAVTKRGPSVKKK